MGPEALRETGCDPSRTPRIIGRIFCRLGPVRESVHLVGDFNNWNPISFPCFLGDSMQGTIRSLAKCGDKYKFRILGADGKLREKTDPGWRFEPPMGNASIIEKREVANLIQKRRNNRVIQETNHF